MLRMSSKKSMQGMVLARPVYDSGGNELAESGETLTEEKARLIAQSDVSRIFVKDPRLADVLVAPLFRPELEAMAIRSVRELIRNNQNVAVIGVARNLVIRLVQCLFPLALGEADVEGCTSLEDYDYAHPVRTATLALAIGRAAGLDQKTLRDLGLAALLMNLGYLESESAMLRKAGALEVGERDRMRAHPARAAGLLENSGLSQEIVDAVQQHHERWDGKGYPEGLQRGAISSLAQIISLADVFHALVSDRPYRKALQTHEAVEFILASSGELFDPELVQFFSRAIPHYPTGLMVRLSTGELAVIIDPNIGHVARPVVRVFLQGGPGAQTYDLDLAKMENMRKLIVGVIQ